MKADIKKQAKFFNTGKLIDGVDKAGNYFFDFLDESGVEAGIIRLRPDEIDDQEPHLLDEIYYVIEGKGYIKTSGKDHKIEKGSVIFLPSGMEHKFHGNKEDLVILYVFGKK